MFSVRNIYCVGRNYALHAQELKNEIPKSPFLFTKPTHAVVEAKGQVITLPGNRGSVHYETELVIHIGDAYKKGISVDQIVDK
ncbi:MAG: fumarylacetoacetate hydrolase family protein, partial [Bacillota bacterium]